MSFNKSLALKNASKYVRQGKYKAAIQEYNDILKADPQDTTTLNLLGDLYVRVEAVPDAVRTFIRVADLYCHTGRATKAIAVLKKAAKLDSYNLECATKLARLFAQEDLLVEAQQQCVVVAECYLHAGLREQGYGVYRELIQRNPDNIEFRLRLAESCLRDEQRDEAYEAFHDAAQTLQRQGRHEESLRTYLKALTAKPDGRGALNAAVNIYLQRGETQPAEALIRHLLRVRPDDPEMLTLLGHVQQMELALTEARRAISTAIEEDPKALQYQVDLVSASDRAYLTFMMAVAELQRQGRERDALNTCLKALKLKPGDKPALFIAVNLYLKLGDTQSAVVMLRHSLRAHPDNVELLLMLGSVYQQAHDASGAEQVMSRAFALQPSCWREVLEFAGYCGRMGERERALRLIDRVMECCDEVHHQHAIIEVLHILLNHDANNLGALERLVNLYTRLYDLPRQVETLKALAEAAVFRGEDETAARALRWLIQLEPDELWHRRLLRNLCPQDEAVQHLVIAQPAQTQSVQAADNGLERDGVIEAEIGAWEVEVQGEDYELAYGYAPVDTAMMGSRPQPEAERFDESRIETKELEPMRAEMEATEAYIVNPESAVVQEACAESCATPTSQTIVAELADLPEAAENYAVSEAESGPMLEAEAVGQAVVRHDEPLREEMAAEPAREVFVSAGSRRRRLLNQRAAQYVPRTNYRRVGGNLPRRAW